MTRILSLIPSATDIVTELGLADRLVGVTYECDAPAGVPRVTTGTIDPEADAAEIDRIVREKARAHETIEPLDIAAIRRLSPDLILTQNLCEVCAVPRREAERAWREAAPAARVLSLAPKRLAEIAADILLVGEAAGVPDRARARAAEFCARIEGVRRRTQDLPRRKVLFLEWTDPPYLPGHWIPEMIEAAGGEVLAGRPGEKSVSVTWDGLLPLPPGTLVAAAPCGMSVERTLRELDRSPLPLPPGQEIWALDGDRHWARPGPHLVRGVEILASVLHPDIFGPPDPAEARLVEISPSH